MHAPPRAAKPQARSDPKSRRKLLKRFRDKLIEFSENPICWDALKAGRDFESEKDGKRAERVLEKGAREKLKEMNQLEKEMDEWSPFDDVEEGRAASKRLELERSGFAPDRNLVAAKEAHQIGARIYSATTTEYIRDV